MGQTGRKIGISGKGRCNLTNDAALEDFLIRFGRKWTVSPPMFSAILCIGTHLFFHREKTCPWVTERGGRVFPESGRALDVVRVLNNWLQTEQVTVQKSAPVSAIQVKDGRVSGVVCNGVTMACTNVILGHRRPVLSADRFYRRWLQSCQKPWPYHSSSAPGTRSSGEPGSESPPHGRA